MCLHVSAVVDEKIPRQYVVPKMIDTLFCFRSIAALSI